jgi:hypothetical protein
MLLLLLHTSSCQGLFGDGRDLIKPIVSQRGFSSGVNFVVAVAVAVDGCGSIGTIGWSWSLQIIGIYHLIFLAIAGSCTFQIVATATLTAPWMIRIIVIVAKVGGRIIHGT